MGLTQQQMATALGIGQARVSALVRAGMPMDSPAEAQAWRSGNLRRYRLPTREPRAPTASAPASGQATGEPGTTAGPQTTSAALTRELLAARVLRETSEAKMAEARAAEAAGTLVSSAKVRAVLSQHFVIARDRLMHLSDRLAPILAGETDSLVIARTLDDEHAAALNEIIVASEKLRGSQADAG